MGSAAWKDLERRVCRALGGHRRASVDGAGGWARGSDDSGDTPFAVECKRTTRYGLRSLWIEQARRNGKASARPWLLVIAEHGDRRPIAVLDFWVLVWLAQRAGLVDTGEVTHAEGEEQAATTLVVRAGAQGEQSDHLEAGEGARAQGQELLEAPVEEAR